MGLFEKLKEKQQRRSQAEVRVEKSLYQWISEALGPEGTLPQDFSLPKVESPNKISFVDGAMDGILCYHSARSHQPVDSLAEVIRLAESGDDKQADEMLQSFFTENTAMFSYMDAVQSWIFDHREEISPQKLFRFAVRELTESSSREAIKFAMTILGMLNVEGDQRLRNVILTLSLSDEFTLYGLLLISEWQNRNKIIFQLAKQVKGWGRIHAVEQLEADTDEVRQWLLTEGWKNDIMFQYSALTCVEKGRLEELLQHDKVEGHQLSAAGALIRSLLSEGPVSGISGIEEPHQLLLSYLKQAEQHPADMGVYKTVRDIREYAIEQDWGDKAAFLSLCDSFLNSQDYIACMEQQPHE